MSFCTLTLMFLYSLGGRPVLYSTKQNILVYQSWPISSKEIKLFTTLILLWVQLKPTNLLEWFFFIQISGGGKLMHYLS